MEHKNAGANLKMREVFVEPRRSEVQKTKLQEKHKSLYRSNKISTTKYTLITYLPICLFNQFKRYANIYFLITAILQSLPYISPLTPVTAIAPLIFVIGVSMIREAYEDYARYTNDKYLNHTMTKVFIDGKWTDKYWQDIRVGDIVKVMEDQPIPCDMIVIETGVSGGPKGSCYIETGSLDGEKSLKQRLSLAEVMERLKDKGLEEFRCMISVNKPTTSLYRLEGALYIESGVSVSITPKQLLLRESFLRNTEYAVGVAIYCGHDSKIMLNSAQSRFKMTLLEQNMNRLILLLLVLQFSLICTSVLGFVLWNKNYYDGHREFWAYKFSLTIESILMFFSYFIIYNTLLPISLMVTIDIAKLFQSFFISIDETMYNQAKGKGCKVMTKSINEELGQVQYVFTDKTGTLTCNVMELKLFSIGNETYGGTLSKKEACHSKFAVEGEFCDDKLVELLAGKGENTSLNLSISSSYSIRTQADLATEYLSLLSTCHECVVHRQEVNKSEVLS